ncbi:MAG: aldo/keto reductase [Devosia sp.]
MAVEPAIQPVRLGAGNKPVLPIAHGGSWYEKTATEADLVASMEVAFAGGIRHFDTASGYAGGRSEELLGDFLKGRRDEIFLASKSNPAELTAAAMVEAIDGSMKRLDVDYIDLYYIHWPQAGQDMRPRMEGLEQARRDGKIGAIGVSNFSVPQLEQVSEVARPSVHQLGYNLLWRHLEAEIIPYCASHDISVVAYSALAHGILTGKFGLDPGLAPDDQRHSILPFRADLWPGVYAGVERMKAIARRLNLPLATLAVRWILAQPGISSVVVGSRNAGQSIANLEVLTPSIAPEFLLELTALSDDISAQLPDVGNLFNHYP